VKLIPINRMSEAQWLAYYQLRLDLRAYTDKEAGAPRYNLEQFQKRTYTIVRQLHGQEYVLFRSRDEKAIGWIRFTGATGDLHINFDYIDAVLPEGFIRLIAKGMDHRFRTYHYPGAFSMVTQERHKVALRRMNPSQEIELLEMEVKPDQVQQAALDAWLADFYARHPGFQLAFASNLPVEVQEDFVQLNKTLKREMPLGGESINSTPWTLESLQRLINVNVQNGQEFYIVFLLNPDGERIGLTELTVHKETGKCAQGLTGVLAPYRGLGMAQALKAEMLRMANALLPTWTVISTHTSPSNHAMRHINAAMGFVHTITSSHFNFLPHPVADYLQQGHEKNQPTKA
jgi:hypothetical protein